MNLFKICFLLLVVFIVSAQIQLIIECRPCNINLKVVLRIFLPILLLILLTFQNKVVYYLGLSLCILGLVNIFFKERIRSDFPLMVITEPIFYYYFEGNTGNIFSKIILRIPIFLYSILFVFFYKLLLGTKSNFRNTTEEGNKL
jgi:hypothetical protein